MEQLSPESAKIEKLFYDRGLKLLSRREHSRSELKRKLLGKPDLPENSSTLVEAVLDRLTENGYLSEPDSANYLFASVFRKVLANGIYWHGCKREALIVVWLEKPWLNLLKRMKSTGINTRRMCCLLNLILPATSKQTEIA